MEVRLKRHLSVHSSRTPSAGLRARALFPGTTAWGTLLALATMGPISGGCADDAATGDEGTTPGTLTIFAASSLTEAFQDMRDLFLDAHPRTDITLVFAGSQTLRLQIEQGAPADIFASADPRHMIALMDSDLVSQARVIASNDLVVIVPPDNPAGIRSFWDLPRARRLVVGTKDVPVGVYTRQALRRATKVRGSDFSLALTGSIVSEENNARLLRAKVELGVADAAVVYRTDADARRVQSIPLPAAVNIRARYRMAVVTRAANVENARRWMHLVASGTGRHALRRRGFIVDTAAAP